MCLAVVALHVFFGFVVVVFFFLNYYYFPFFLLNCRQELSGGERGFQPFSCVKGQEKTRGWAGPYMNTQVLLNWNYEPRRGTNTRNSVYTLYSGFFCSYGASVSPPYCGSGVGINFCLPFSRPSVWGFLPAK